MCTRFSQLDPVTIVYFDILRRELERSPFPSRIIELDLTYSIHFLGLFSPQLLYIQLHACVDIYQIVQIYRVYVYTAIDANVCSSKSASRMRSTCLHFSAQISSKSTESVCASGSRKFVVIEGKQKPSQLEGEISRGEEKDYNNTQCVLLNKNNKDSRLRSAVKLNLETPTQTYITLRYLERLFFLHC